MSWGDDYDHGVNLSDRAELAARVEAVELAGGSAGNPDVLRRYWESGKGGQMIKWGAPEEGDLSRCHALLMEHAGMDSEQAWGYCQDRKIAVSGHGNKLSEEVVEFAEADGYANKRNTEKQKTCTVCTKGFHGRADQSTCSPACRMKKSRS